MGWVCSVILLLALIEISVIASTYVNINQHTTIYGDIYEYTVHSSGTARARTFK